MRYRRVRRNAVRRVRKSQGWWRKFTSTWRKKKGWKKLSWAATILPIAVKAGFVWVFDAAFTSWRKYRLERI